MLLELGNAPEAALNATTAMEIDASESVTDSPSWWRICLWLGLSASGSVMLLATTNQLCIDVATVSFLWVLPLSIYLVTFILCFDNPRWYDRRVSGLLLSVAAPAACWALRKEADVAILDQTVIYSLVLFACCMACHGELVRSRPTPKYLTLFFPLGLGGRCARWSVCGNDRSAVFSRLLGVPHRLGGLRPDDLAGLVFRKNLARYTCA